MKNLNMYFLVIVLMVAFNAMAEDVTIKGIDLKQSKGLGVLSVKLSGNLIENPELKVIGKTIVLTIPNAHTTKLFKKNGDVLLSANQLDRSTVKVSAVFPTSFVGKENLVTVTLKDGSVDLNFPSAEVKINSKISRAPAIIDEQQIEAVNKEAEKLDENYLQNLEKEQQKIADQKHPENVKGSENNTLDKQDRVKLSQSSVLKSNTGATQGIQESPKSSFSIAGYVGKFVAFLSIMILGFYGVLTLFKKGIIKKGKLGFLHSTKIVEVLSTTHIAPKRTLMMVKAHKQVFLISSTETGMQLVSEISDVAGLIKSGEQEITGSNFDTNLNTANSNTKEFRLKEEDFVDYGSLDEMLNEPPIQSSNSTNAAKAIAKAPVKDSVRFSDQIKSKVKNLKQLP